MFGISVSRGFIFGLFCVTYAIIYSKTTASTLAKCERREPNGEAMKWFRYWIVGISSPRRRRRNWWWRLLGNTAMTCAFCFRVNMHTAGVCCVTALANGGHTTEQKKNQIKTIDSISMYDCERVISLNIFAIQFLFFFLLSPAPVCLSHQSHHHWSSFMKRKQNYIRLHIFISASYTFFLLISFLVLVRQRYVSSKLYDYASTWGEIFVFFSFFLFEFIVH